MRKDITGQRFGKLVAVRPTDKRTKDKNVVWELRCDCGNACEAPTSELLRGRITSCGCGRGQSRSQDLAGLHFGKLMAVRRLGSNAQGSAIWECRCECGQVCEATATALTSGAKRSCGCMAGGKPSGLAGRRFGKLVALKPVGRKGGYAVWECACDCGNHRHATTYQLTSGRATSCGCDSTSAAARARAARHLPVPGQRFGKLAAIDIREGAGNGEDAAALVRCVCDCDRVVTVPLPDLLDGRVTSCGVCREVQ